MAQSQSLRNKAEMVVSEMESAATIQLQGLANKSEAAINQLKTKLDKAIERGEEFQAFVKVKVLRSVCVQLPNCKRPPISGVLVLQYSSRIL